MKDIKNKIVETSALLVGLCAQLDGQLKAIDQDQSFDGETFDAVMRTAKKGKTDELLSARIEHAETRKRALDKLTPEERKALMPSFC